MKETRWGCAEERTENRGQFLTVRTDYELSRLRLKILETSVKRLWAEMAHVHEDIQKFKESHGLTYMFRPTYYRLCNRYYQIDQVHAKTSMKLERLENVQ